VAIAAATGRIQAVMAIPHIGEENAAARTFSPSSSALSAIAPPIEWESR